jgi:DNA end-binding protein Ku
VRAIEIEQFVERASAEERVRFVRQSYYLEPDKIGRKAFALLRAVLSEHGLSAICKVVIKDREALAALDPFDDTMILSTLYWPDEIRSVKDLEIPAETPEFKAAEKAMAEQLVAAMTRPFDPEEYHDEYREALTAIIEARIEGREAEPAPAAESASIVDLMAALQASVAAASQSRESTAPISVSEAKARRAAGARSPAGEKASAAEEGRSAGPRATRRGPRTGSDGSAEPETASRPARRRKSA